jgi:hypothetical protein
MKTPEQYFADWESGVFGYGYGTGEEHVLGALKDFFRNTAFTDRFGSVSYDYQNLERELTPRVAWLLINVLAKAGAIEYGTSPRFGWLTPGGKALAAFIDAHSIEQLEESVQNSESICFPDHCNCNDSDCRPGNPFWPKWQQATSGDQP